MNEPKPLRSGAVYSRLVIDRDVSHGAFRLWHLLRSKYANTRGTAWPGQRRIAEDLGCDPHSLKPWTKQLVAGGYLAVENYTPTLHPEVSGKLEGFVYRLLEAPLEVLQVSTSPRCGNPHHPVAGLPPGGVAGLPPGGVAETCNVTNPIELIPLNQGGRRAPRFTPPTIDEVKAYAGEIQLAASEAEKFFDYYQSKGWQVGKTPMRDWKAALRNWQRRNDSPMKGADHAAHQRNNSRNALTY